MDSTNNTTTATTLISVDQATLLRVQNENESLHKLVIELQASNAQLQSQLLNIQVSNTITKILILTLLQVKTYIVKLATAQ